MSGSRQPTPHEPAPATGTDRFRRALDTLSEAVMLLEVRRSDGGEVSDLVVGWANAAAVDAHGRTSHQIIDQGFTDLWPSPDGRRAFELFREVLDHGRAVRDPDFVYRFDDGGDVIEVRFDITAAPFEGGLVVSWRDVTAEQEARERLEASERMLAQAQRIGRMGSWRVRVGVDETIELSDEMRRMLGEPVHRRADLLAAIPDGQRDQLVAAIRRALQGGDQFSLEHRMTHPTLGQLEVRTTGQAERDGAGEIVAVAGVTHDVTDERRAERQLDHLTAELVEEHRALQALQRALLPSVPEVDGYEIEARYLSSADRVEVGGDWYDVVAVDADHVAVVVGDVAGHGLPAVGTMAKLRHTLAAHLAAGASPGEALDRTNRRLRADGGEMATCIVAQVRLATGQVRWASAGHFPPVVQLGGRTSRLSEGVVGPPLGVVREAGYVEASVGLDVEDAFLLHTDGLVERRGEPIDDGLARLVRRWDRRSGEPHQLDRLLGDLFALDGHPDRLDDVDDDVCLVVCCRSGPGDDCDD